MTSDASALARTPQPPYWAVVFTSLRTLADEPGYARTAERMVELARRQVGYLGHESARDERGLGITVSYWESLDAIERWRTDQEHLEAQRLGRERWYACFRLRVCRVEREHGCEAPSRASTSR